MNPWWMLAGAVVFEVAATTALKLSDGFTRLMPSLFVVLGYATSFFFLSRVLRSVEMGVVYAVWCAAGLALIAVIGIVVFGESISLLKILGLLAITVGVVLLSMVGSGH